MNAVLRKNDSIIASDCLKLIDAIDPIAYAKTRNHIDGAVTRLSPWITHGVMTLRELATILASRYRLPVQHKLIYEWGWRAYFRHVHSHRPELMTTSMHSGPLADHAYAQQAPAALIQARTGVPAIDRAVRDLYEQGYVHNHARMWIASFWVHICRVRWQAGANWMLKHLLDGDMASNALSWQWVAGTFSKKPYLFNAENVARFAPKTWWSPGTTIDQDYASIEQISTGGPLPQWPDDVEPRCEPICLAPSSLQQEFLVTYRIKNAYDYFSEEKAKDSALEKPKSIPKPYLIVHPWAIRQTKPLLTDGKWHLLGFIPSDTTSIHWSLNRWRWVLDRMKETCHDIIIGSLQDLYALQSNASSLHTWHDIHLHDYWPSFVEQHHEAALFPTTDRFHASFSSWWHAISRKKIELHDLLSCHVQSNEG